MSNASPHTRRAFADAVRALAAAHRAMSDGDAGAPPSAPPSATPPPDVRPPGLSAVTRSGPSPRATESVAGLAERASTAEADAGDDTERFMSPALVKRRIDAALSTLVDGAPDALDTLNELAAALGDDASFASSLTQTLAAKADSAHHHDGDYATASHEHSDYAASDHDHDGDYATASHEHSDYAASNHDHDGRYYTEAEADRRFARQVNAGRAHPGIVQLDDIATLRAAMDATPAAYDRAVSTRALALLVASESRRGLAERADAAEADAGDDTERFMTAALVKRRIDAALSTLVDGAPDALDTLNELAAALGDDASFATSLTQTLAAKADSAHHHDGDYATASHEHSDYAASNHIHDGRYYTEAEADRRFARRVNAGRTHPGIVQLDDIATLRAAMDATPAAYDRAVSTRALALLVASESRRGLAERASTAEADAGDDTERFMPPALVKRRIDAALGDYATASHEHSDYAASDHDHDGRYYTEAETNRRFARANHTHSEMAVRVRRHTTGSGSKVTDVSLNAQISGGTLTLTLNVSYAADMTQNTQNTQNTQMSQLP